MIIDKSFPYTLSVNWQSPENAVFLDKALKSWILNTQSLTERLQNISENFRVRLLGQEDGLPLPDESILLSEPLAHRWQVREVILQGGQISEQQDWVFARSILPQGLCESKLAKLGEEPLGQRIFNDKEFVRSDFEVGELTQHPLNGQVFKPGKYWARRSRFTIANFELIVAEAFLPDAPCYW